MAGRRLPRLGLATLVAISTWLTRGSVSAAARISIKGEATCPTAAAVAARLPSLLRAHEADSGEEHHARIDNAAGTPWLRLEDGAGRLIAQRSLDSHGSCPALAEAAAVILATWETTLRPGDVPGPPTVSAGPAAIVANETRSPSVGRRSLFDLGAGATTVGGTGAATATVTWGLAAELSFVPFGGAFGLTLNGRFTQSRRLDVGDRAVDWRRTTMAVGPTYVRRWDRWQWATAAGGELGWFRADGSDFPVNLGGNRLSPGVFASTRLARLLTAHTAVALAVGASVGLSEHQLIVIGNDQQRRLRPRDLFASLLVCIGRFR